MSDDHNTADSSTHLWILLFEFFEFELLCKREFVAGLRRHFPLACGHAAPNRIAQSHPIVLLPKRTAQLIGADQRRRHTAAATTTCT
jgi:hypothetical protein